MSLLRKQQSRCLGPPKSPSPGLAFGQAGLSTARGEAGCFIRLKCYGFCNTLAECNTTGGTWLSGPIPSEVSALNPPWTGLPSTLLHSAKMLPVFS